MKQEGKEKWVAALRSGEYKQGAGCLRSKDNYYCCLGVLADLYSKDTGVPWEAPVGGQNSYAVHQQSGILPIEVAEWADIRDEAGKFDPCPVVVIRNEGEDIKVYECLTGLNDDGSTFSEIADYIEASR